MPLRDHFHPPLLNRHSWEGFHGMWPALIVQRLVPQLPQEYSAEPRVHLGALYEIDVCAFEEDEPDELEGESSSDATEGGLATATWAPPKPTLVADTEFAGEYEYEVLVYDDSRARQLVAAVEIVSPANKDRRKSRRSFVMKCAALLQQGVCVSIVDLVTTRKRNLYTQMLSLIEQPDPAFAAKPPGIYAVTCRVLRHEEMNGRKNRFEAWAYPLVLGQPLPVLPLWLTGHLAVSLDLESSYEETCRVLRLA